MSQFFASGGPSIGASGSASVLPMNIQDWFTLGWTGWISFLLSKSLSRIFSNTTVQKHQFFSTQPSVWSNTHIYTWLLEKSQLWLRQTFVVKIMSLLFNIISRLVITFLPRSKSLSVSWLQSPSAVIFSSDQFSHSVVSNSLRPHESQHARPPWSSPTPGVHSDSCPSSRWCHPTVSSSVVPFSSHLQSFPASRFFPMSQFIASSGQSIGASASASVLPTFCLAWLFFSLSAFSHFSD